MSRGAVKYIDTTYMYGQQVQTSPVSSPVIYGRFPKYSNKKSTEIKDDNKAQMDESKVKN